MSETNDELDLNDSDVEDIMDATDVSSDEEFSDKEPPQPHLVLLALLHQRNILGQGQIMLKKLRKIQINTKNYAAH